MFHRRGQSTEALTLLPRLWCFLVGSLLLRGQHGWRAHLYPVPAAVRPGQAPEPCPLAQVMLSVTVLTAALSTSCSHASGFVFLQERGQTQAL